MFLVCLSGSKSVRMRVLLAQHVVAHNGLHSVHNTIHTIPRCSFLQLPCHSRLHSCPNKARALDRIQKRKRRKKERKRALSSSLTDLLCWLLHVSASCCTFLGGCGICTSRSYFFRVLVFLSTSRFTCAPRSRVLDITR